MTVPPKRKTKTKGKKKRVSKQPLGAPMGKSIGFPNNKVVRMRYVSYGSITTNGISMGLNQYRANGIYDPDYTNVGHQPYTSDQWALFYNHYTVLGSKITIQASAVSTLAFPCMLGIYLSDDATIPTDWETLRESGRGSQVQLPIASTIKDKTLSCKFSSKAFFGKKSLGDAVGASVGADPTEQAIFNIYVQSLDKATSIANQIGITITIDYIVMYSEPKDLASS